MGTITGSSSAEIEAPIEQVWGVVEDVQSGCFHSFHSAEDLWLVLASPVTSNSIEGKTV